jgi:hypothetical protein
VAVHPVNTMNRPVQVMLDLEDRRRARRRAAELGVTLTEYIRRLVREDLDAWTPDSDASAIIAIEDAESGPHNRYIGEAVAARIAKADPTIE